MEVYVVLYETHRDQSVSVLDVYEDINKAETRVQSERDKIGSNPHEKLRDECWYETKKVIR